VIGNSVLFIDIDIIDYSWYYYWTGTVTDWFELINWKIEIDRLFDGKWYIDLMPALLDDYRLTGTERYYWDSDAVNYWYYPWLFCKQWLRALKCFIRE